MLSGGTRGLCSRCALTPERRSTWAGNCPLAAAVADLCPFRSSTKAKAALRDEPARYTPKQPSNTDSEQTC